MRRPRSSGGTDWLRWGVALTVVLAVVVALLFADRRATTPPDLATPTTVGPAAGRGTGPADGVTETRVAVPGGLAGTLYALADDATLLELDLAGGRARRAALTFDVTPWLVAQVVALEDVVLVSTRRRVVAVDRATLTVQTPVAEDRWVVAPADGGWAALVPFGGGTADVVLLDGAGVPAGGRPVRLPAGATVQGAVGDGLVIDAAGTLQLLRIEDRAVVPLGPGRLVAAGGGSALARLTCVALACELRAGSVERPDAARVEPVAVATDWIVGHAGVIDPAGTRLAVVRAASAGPLVALADLAAAEPRWRDGPVAPAPPGALPAIAFSADGSAVIHAAADGLVLWRPGPGDAVTAVPLGATVLAVTVSPQPPPPPPTGGPPPSFA